MSNRPHPPGRTSPTAGADATQADASVTSDADRRDASDRPSLRSIPCDPETGQPTDEGLLTAYVDGDLEAFATLLQRYEKPVFRFIYRYTGDYQRAEDVFQETFVRIMRAASDTTMHSFGAWIYRIARNLCIDASRRERYRQAISLHITVGENEDSGGRLVDRIEADDRPPEDGVINEELSVAMREAIERLSPEQREVFLLREQVGLPFKEVAAIVGAPENTVKSRMRYALENLREQLVRAKVWDGALIAADGG